MMEEALPYLGVEAQYSEEEYQNLDTSAPSLVGMPLEEAYAELEKAGLGYSVTGDESEGNLVTAQVPESGSPVPKDGKVVLYTDGYDEEATYVEVPDFTGYRAADASYVAGLTGVQVSVSGSAADTATVTDQSIKPGEKVKEGTVIALTFVDFTNTETGGAG